MKFERRFHYEGTKPFVILCLVVIAVMAVIIFA